MTRAVTDCAALVLYDRRADLSERIGKIERAAQAFPRIGALSRALDELQAALDEVEQRIREAEDELRRALGEVA